jgi:hypothetical protein
MVSGCVQSQDQQVQQGRQRHEGRRPGRRIYRTYEITGRGLQELDRGRAGGVQERDILPLRLLGARGWPSRWAVAAAVGSWPPLLIVDTAAAYADVCPAGAGLDPQAGDPCRDADSGAGQLLPERLGLDALPQIEGYDFPIFGLVRPGWLQLPDQ